MTDSFNLLKAKYSQDRLLFHKTGFYVMSSIKHKGNISGQLVDYYSIKFNGLTAVRIIQETVLADGSGYVLKYFDQLCQIALVAGDIGRQPRLLRYVLPS